MFLAAHHALVCVYIPDEHKWWIRYLHTDQRFGKAHWCEHPLSGRHSRRKQCSPALGFVSGVAKAAQSESGRMSQLDYHLHEGGSSVLDSRHRTGLQVVGEP